jgi:hypothetical protein
MTEQAEHRSRLWRAAPPALIDSAPPPRTQTREADRLCCFRCPDRLGPATFPVAPPTSHPPTHLTPTLHRYPLVPRPSRAAPISGQPAALQPHPSTAPAPQRRPAPAPQHAPAAAARCAPSGRGDLYTLHIGRTIGPGSQPTRWRRSASGLPLNSDWGTSEPAAPNRRRPPPRPAHPPPPRSRTRPGAQQPLPHPTPRPRAGCAFWPAQSWHAEPS